MLLSLWGIQRFNQSSLFNDDSICLQHFCCYWHWRCIKGFYHYIPWWIYWWKTFDLDTNALRHIKVSRGAYNLHKNLGMNIILKVYKNSSDIFNWNILNYYANNNELETMYDLKEPRIKENNNSYTKYGSVGVCVYLQDKYGKCFKNSCWPALTKINFPVWNTSRAKEENNND